MLYFCLKMVCMLVCVSVCGCVRERHTHTHRQRQSQRMEETEGRRCGEEDRQTDKERQKKETLFHFRERNCSDL